ncbi:MULTISPECIES: GNAT family N-acetyltransferase [Rhizobium]|uniref:N-acetyltransferase n=1 Tax=Rhizobium sophoriradicis TaxID=1535245 RepID=A0A2A5KP44_9HYPH|nr:MULTISPECIES: GNAT family N-acetyltransferase [Rhizobium]PCK78782.1 N-acetyltransferase [Rhizobium sophoriradicis]RSC20510.1 GNAT family N-acetyltransferase [Rhizobium sophoriradicis]UWU36192.1 GNAT family N-acetyltransferase [Rhizobium leguminosarum bv. phaseoli]
MVVTDLTIRTIVPADHEAVGAVGFAAWAAGGAFEDCYRDPHVIAKVQQEFAAFPHETKGEIFVAEQAGEIVGWTAREGERNYVSDLWVHPYSQGKGVGRALLSYLYELMAAEGLATVRLDTHARNERAIRLYERCGFTIIWHGVEFSKSMGVPLEKVHMEKQLADRPNRR